MSITCEDTSQREGSVMLGKDNGRESHRGLAILVIDAVSALII